MGSRYGGKYKSVASLSFHSCYTAEIISKISQALIIWLHQYEFESRHARGIGFRELPDHVSA